MEEKNKLNILKIEDIREELTEMVEDKISGMKCSGCSCGHCGGGGCGGCGPSCGGGCKASYKFVKSGNYQKKPVRTP